MAEFQYIDKEEAKKIMPEPLAQIDDEAVLTKCISDASEEIDIALKSFGLKVTTPIAEKYRTEYFEITVTYWTAAQAYLKHSHQVEEADYWEKKARKRLKDFFDTTHWEEDAVTQDVAVPRTLQYSDKGDVKPTDLTDPHDLHYD
jgi:hypothetical protein